MKRTRFIRMWRRMMFKLGFDRDGHLVVLAAVIGVIMGGVAYAFIWPLRQIEEWAAEVDRSTLVWLVPIAPAVGALIAGTIIHVFGKQAGSPGVAAVLYAINRNGSKIRKRVGVRKWLAATATIGSGGSAGAEGPIVTIGATIGSNIGQWMRTSPQNTATLLGCGAAAGMASVFNAPIAGIFFVMEILLRDFSLRTFTPIVIAAVLSSATTQAMLGTDALFNVQTNFAEAAFAGLEIPNYLILGLFCGLAGAVFIRGLYLTHDLFDRLRVHGILKPVIGAALLGVLGIVFMWARSTDQLPAFYGNGYPVVGGLLDDMSYKDPATGLLKPLLPLLGLLAVIALLKPLATCLTVGSGGSGGLFAPSLVFGAAMGGLFGTIVNALDWGPAASPAYYAVVGMAATVAAVLHAPLTAILMVYEITRSYEIILPLMLASVISTVVARMVSRHSAYTEQLARQGIEVDTKGDLRTLRSITVESVQLQTAVFVHPSDSGQRLMELSEQHASADFVVVDDRDHHVGMVTGEEMRTAFVFHEAIPLLQVSELMRSDLPAVSRDETLDRVIEKFGRHDVQSLPVLGNDGSGRVVGVITRSELMRAYQRALTRE